MKILNSIRTIILHDFYLRQDSRVSEEGIRNCCQSQLFRINTFTEFLLPHTVRDRNICFPSNGTRALPRNLIFACSVDKTNSCVARREEIECNTNAPSNG